MSKLVNKNKESGLKTYNSRNGYLSSDAVKKADLLLEKIKKELPKYEEDILQLHDSNSLREKYLLGKFIYEEIVLKESITEREYPILWKELYDFVDSKQNLLKRTQSTNRNTFLYCYKLYRLDENIVFKLTWRQWNDIFDRSFHSFDQRFFNWISSNNSISNEQFRFLLMAINYYYSKVDTTLLNDFEFDNSLTNILKIVLLWYDLKVAKFDSKGIGFTKARIENLSKYRKKYIELAIDLVIKSDYADIANISAECFDKFFIV